MENNSNSTESERCTVGETTILLKPDFFEPSELVLQELADLASSI